MHYTSDTRHARNPVRKQDVMTSTVLAIGEQVPDFKLKTLDGQELGVSAFSGKRLIVFCWASW